MCGSAMVAADSGCRWACCSPFRDDVVAKLTHLEYAFHGSFAPVRCRKRTRLIAPEARTAMDGNSSHQRAMDQLSVEHL